MKKYYSIFIVLFSAIGFSQSPELFDETWYLEKLIIDEVNYFPPVNATLPYVSLEFYENNSLLTSVCNSGYGEINFPEDNIFMMDVFAVTLSFCLDESNEYFEGIYLLDYYQNNSSGQFSYTILVGEDGVNKLTITNSENNQAIYYNQNLATQSFERNNWSFYPNPTKDFLYFNNEDIKISSMEIYDVLGKLCISKTIDANNRSVSTADLMKGVYLIKIFNDNETFSSKFIKE